MVGRQNNRSSPCGHQDYLLTVHLPINVICYKIVRSSRTITVAATCRKSLVENSCKKVTKRLTNRFQLIVN